MLKTCVHNALFLCFEVCKMFPQHDGCYKAHIAARMKRCRPTHIIPACQHSGIKNVLNLVRYYEYKSIVLWVHTRVHLVRPC